MGLNESEDMNIHVYQHELFGGGISHYYRSKIVSQNIC